MTTQQNVETVRRGYEAFVRGDLDALLGLFDEQVEWRTPGPADLPTAGQRRGHGQVREFFGTLNQMFEIQRFEPRTFVAEGDRVVVLGEETARVRSTGKVIEQRWAHAFTFSNGKVTAFDEYLDTAAVVTELRLAQSPT
jgi:uncharacterized protein